jgi:hypothetical protein
MVALAFFAQRKPDNDEWRPPSDLEPLWLESLRHLRPAEMTVSRSSYEVTELLKFLCARHPSLLVELVTRSIMDAGDRIYGALPHDGWEVLSSLPAAQKTELWNWSQHSPSVRWMLSDHLAGHDVGWVESMLDSGVMSTDDVMSLRRGFGSEPTIEELARLLIPRGVAPEKVAGLAMAGSWMGEESDRYRSLIEYFGELNGSEDENLRDVGDAGVRIFTEASDAALAKERKRRVRGEP